MAPVPILPPEPLGTLKETRHQASSGASTNLAERSLDSIVFLFQVLMAFSITNGAYIFVTSGSGGYDLRPWSSFTFYQSLAFLVFVATLIPFAHANVLIFYESYGSGFTDKGLQPLVDFFLLFLEAGIFYALSHASARVDVDYLSFFVVAGAILAVDVMWALITFAFDHKRTIVLVYAFLNTSTLLLGGLLITQKVAHPRELLLLTLAVRTVLDFALTYTYLFPNAFKVLTADGAVPVRNLSIVAVVFIGFGGIFPLANLGPSLEAFHLPMLYLGIVLEAVAWVLGIIRTASTKEWVWFSGILVYTIIMPLIGDGLLAVQTTTLAGTALLVLTPLVTLIYGIAGPR